MPGRGGNCSPSPHVIREQSGSREVLPEKKGKLANYVEGLANYPDERRFQCALP